MWLISIWTFMARMADGSCGWMIELDKDVAMLLPDGTPVTGDEVHLIEEVAKGGHYPYTVVRRHDPDRQPVGDPSAGRDGLPLKRPMPLTSGLRPWRSSWRRPRLRPRRR